MFHLFPSGIPLSVTLQVLDGKRGLIPPWQKTTASSSWLLILGSTWNTNASGSKNLGVGATEWKEKLLVIPVEIQQEKGKHTKLQFLMETEQIDVCSLSLRSLRS